MELALSLGGGDHHTSKPFLFLENSSSSSSLHHENKLLMDNSSSRKDLGFCMSLGKRRRNDEEKTRIIDQDPSLQLDLLPFSSRNTPSQLCFPWLTENIIAAEPGLTNGPAGKKAVDTMNRRQLMAEEAEEGAAMSSPNSAISSFQVNFPIFRNGKLPVKRDHSEDEEDGSARKKLRLTKEQSAFLEESFKEHNTLNPKQKLALAKQLNLRPRQVEVWFQNRRARTKLKQTEVDCEYLKRCCETLTEENKRLQKELQELRALKSSQPYYMQLPATTLTMCPSCERVATTTTTTTTATATAADASAAAKTGLSLAKPKLLEFSQVQVQAPQAAS